MLGSLLEFLKNCCTWLIDKVEFVFITVVNALISAVAAVAGAVISVLPASAPGDTVPSALPDTLFAGNSFLGVLNWFLPVNHIVASLMFYLSAVVIYFTVAPLLRWVKILK